MNDIEIITQKLEETRKTVGALVHVLDKMNTTMEEGFENVNKRLSELEGKNGMQGVNRQLGDIKHELSKIQKVYPYEEMMNNIETVKGQA